MNNEIPNQFARMMDLLRRLKEARISHSLNDNREDSISILAFAPGEYWEIDFLADGDVDVERYRSNGTIEDGSAVIEELFRLWADDEPVSTAKEPPHATVS